MKLLRYFSLLILLACMAGSASAYRVNVLDPNFTTHGFKIQPFSISFDTCQIGQLPTDPTAGQFCFTGQNLTGSTLTTLEVILPSSGAFAGKTPICSISSDSLFQAATCGTNGTNQVFYFSGLDIPDYKNHSVPHASLLSQFTIVIEDLPPNTTPSLIPGGNGGFVNGQPNQMVPIPPSQIIPSVPEPSSIVLFSTGILSLAGARLCRKSAQA